MTQQGETDPDSVRFRALFGAKDDANENMFRRKTDDASFLRAPRIQRINVYAVAVAFVLAIVAVSLLISVLRANAHAEATHTRYEECVDASTELMDASDLLTSEARLYVVTGDRTHLDAYLKEINETKSRDHAVAVLNREGDDAPAALRLSTALDESNRLAERELYAMCLTAQATGLEDLPEDLRQVRLDAQDLALSSKAQIEKADDMLLGEVYTTMKNLIIADVDGCANELIEGLRQDEVVNKRQVTMLLWELFAVVMALLAIFAAMVWANFVLVMRPMRIHALNIRGNEPLTPTGSYEVRYVAQSYNQIYKENHRRTMLLKREAETDPLTGLLNRGSYDKLVKYPTADVVLLLIDIDYFKEVNDTYGHEIGDQILKKVANSISYHFRTTDYVCRIGGDEFAVVMTEMNHQMRALISDKVTHIAAKLADTSDGLPSVTLSVGIASSLVLGEGEGIYHAADSALYVAKRAGRSRFAFYGEGNTAHSCGIEAAPPQQSSR